MFRTEINIPSSPEKINHEHKLLTIGSCFSQVIGEQLKENKFEVVANPFGTVFNPVSIFRILESVLKNDFSLLDRSVESNGVWFNYHTHSDFFGNTREALELKIKDQLQKAHAHLLKTNFLIITLGTAFVYRLKKENEIVANCHKIPAAHFTKELLSVQEVVRSFETLHAQLKSQLPALKIILTVSPVRHTKDTLPLNAVSKAALRLVCHECSEKHENVFYFPSYEIMMDDLRDYRFYKQDMIHPTEVAEEYIWNKFSETYFSEETKKILSEWASLLKALQHKPFRGGTKEHSAFLEDTLSRLKKLNGKINLEEEINDMLNKI
ncbi:MAG TPA: GSCFA domain-containing protein [Cytophagaceae bacterium]|nr:GSCFA domain-containing protein [Cytophagaceae bacterium]